MHPAESTYFTGMPGNEYILEIILPELLDIPDFPELLTDNGNRTVTSVVIDIRYPVFPMNDIKGLNAGITHLVIRGRYNGD